MKKYFQVRTAQRAKTLFVTTTRFVFIPVLIGMFLLNSCQKEEEIIDKELNSEEIKGSIYKDQDYDFQFTIPDKSWEITTRWNEPNVPSHAITKRISLLRGTSEIILDVFNKPMANPENWLQNYLGDNSDNYHTKMNDSSIIFLEKSESLFSMIGVIFNTKSNFIMIQYSLKDSGSSIETYKNLLLSFTSSFVPVLDPNLEIPTKINLELSKLHTSKILVNNCCGVVDNGNPFPCDNGNCTWWVYYKKSYVPFTGNANRWGERTKSGMYPGWYVDSYNYSNGDIAWWDNSGARPFGHVAYVEGGNNGNTVSISEMTWQGNACANEPVSRNISRSSCDGFIRKTNQPF